MYAAISRRDRSRARDDTTERTVCPTIANDATPASRIHASASWLSNRLEAKVLGIGSLHRRCWETSVPAFAPSGPAHAPHAGPGPHG